MILGASYGQNFSRHCYFLCSPCPITLKLLMSVIIIIVMVAMVRKMKITLVISNRGNLTKGLVYKSIGKTRDSRREKMRCYSEVSTERY